MTAQYIEDFPDSGDPAPESPAVADVAHPATAYFSARLRSLSETIKLREVETGEVRKLNAPALYALLEEQSPDLAISLRQMHRYYNGTATPRIDVVYEIARLVGVSPRVFLPPSTDGEATVDGDPKNS